MKQGLTRSTVILIVLGVILFADVVVFFDSASGFLAGNALWRYLLFALGLVSIWLFSRARSKTVSGAAVPVSRVKTAAAAASAVSAFYSIFIVIFSAMGINDAPAGHHSTPFTQALDAIGDVACAVLFLGMAVWLFVIARRFLSETNSVSANTLLLSGCVVLIGPIITLLRQAALRSVSSQRLSILLPVLAMLFSLGFLMAFSRLLFADDEKNLRRVTFWGLSSFFFGVCLALPQTLYLSFTQPYSLALLPQTVFSAGIGILGLCTAQWAPSAALTAPASEQSKPE